MFSNHFGPRMQRGDLSPIILWVLKEKPMHGYEIIRTLEDRSHGMWRPSPGSVYPILQYLEEQDLVTSIEQSGKKVYSVTEKGKKQAVDIPSQHPWKAHARAGKHFREMKAVIHDMIQTMREIGLHGTDEQQIETRALLKEMRDRLQMIAENNENNSTNDTTE